MCPCLWHVHSTDVPGLSPYLSSVHISHILVCVPVCFVSLSLIFWDVSLSVLCPHILVYVFVSVVSLS